jgi:hypothetical protein
MVVATIIKSSYFGLELNYPLRGFLFVFYLMSSFKLFSFIFLLLANLNYFAIIYIFYSE